MVGIVGREHLIVDSDSGEDVAEGIANLMEELPENSRVFSLAILEIVRPPETEIETETEKKKESLLKRVT